MLNLSDIRKKANKKGKGKKSPGRSEAEEPEQRESEALTSSPEGTERVEEAGQTATPVKSPEAPEPKKAFFGEAGAPPESAAPVTGKTESDESVADREAKDPLESLFSANPELDLATEEAYFEGLVGQERETEENQCQLLSFALGEEEYAVDIQDVQEIIKLREMTDIPRVPGFVLGIISLRGTIIPVFDLKRRLQLGTAEPTPSTRIVVCRDGGKAVGLVVDKINQVVRLPEQAIEQVSGILSGVNKDLVEGVGRYQGRMLILLDLPSVLAVEQH